MKNRIKVYEAARALNALRLKKGIRNWFVPDKAALNPTDEIKEKIKLKPSLLKQRLLLFKMLSKKTSH